RRRTFPSALSATASFAETWRSSMAVNLKHPDSFVLRHIGPREEDVAKMLRTVGAKSLDELIDKTVPAGIRLRRPLDLPAGKTEHELLTEASRLGAKNEVFRSYLGMGYSDCITPPGIL